MDEIESQLQRIIKIAKNYIRNCKSADSSNSATWDNKIHNKAEKVRTQLQNELDKIKKHTASSKYYEKIEEAEKKLKELIIYSTRFNKL